ncbi:hypothetical protein CRM89_00325 [Nocardia sp. FDAARGOS_372]|uniref:Hint domain-containing protein n=1 Tax=Nocardia sp. FDAARGOS_372 TaxID=2018066 RepID=UPI000BF1869B|nr:Hint domain-containing protein [Nocardia sp. FDAARGOS_372]PEH74631.1 hypothetical protein CRM89_00325 [Nocardia sp. FDAARGOS_372]
MAGLTTRLMDLESAAMFDRLQRQAAVDAIEEIAKRWATSPPNDFGVWFDRNIARLTRAVEAGQSAAVRDVERYVDDALDEQNIRAPKVATPTHERLVGVTADGRTIEGLLAQTVIGARAAMAEGVPAYKAWQDAGYEARRVISNEIADAGRAATGVGIVSRLGVGYVRMLVPPSCSRCVILAGRYYHWSRGFRRHPNCFPAGTVVSGPSAEAATRRWFEGELVVFTTASGKQLSLTGNHPVLTRGGWVPANLLNEGDEVVRSTRPQGATPLVVPDHHQVPALIEDVWGSFAVNGLHRVPAAPEDFHGDGQRGEVDIVGPDRTLWCGHDAAIAQQREQQFFTRRTESSGLLVAKSVAQLVDLWQAPHSGSSIGRSGLPFALIGGHGGGPVERGLTVAAGGYPGLHEALADYRPGDAVLPPQGVFAGSSEIGGDDCVIGKVNSTRWDAPALPFLVEGRAGYASRGKELFDRLTGQVELDRIVILRRVQWSGHVFSLTSSEGWHTANSLIVSNCNCRHIPSREDRADEITTDPKKYFESLSEADQNKTFGQAGAQAIRDGADMSQVVNARRGLTIIGGRAQRSEVYGRRLLTTTEGVTRRGQAGRAMRARGRNARTTPRLMPEAIYEIAETRAEAIELLRKYGYVA